MVSLENKVEEVVIDEPSIKLKYINEEVVNPENEKILFEIDRIIGHILSGEKFKKVSIQYSLVNKTALRAEKISGKILF